MLLNYFEESIIRNSKLPVEWQSQSSLDELQAFLQLNWEQRAVFYDDGELKSRQQFLGFVPLPLRKHWQTGDYAD